MSRKRDRVLTNGNNNSNIVVEDVPRFRIEDNESFSQAMKYMSTHGMVMFDAVLTEAECAQAIDKFWEYMHDCTEGRVKRSDPSTWTNANWPLSYGSGIIQTNGIGSSNFMWFIRTNTKVRLFFELFFNTQNLMCSLDGCGAFRGPEHKFSPNNNWLHADVNLNLRPPNLDREGIQTLADTVTTSIQSQVTLLPVDGDETGSFCWIDASHKEYLKEWTANPKGHDTIAGSRSHYCPLPENHPLRSKQVSLLRAPAGSMIVWDSALIHCNVAPKTDATSSSKRFKQAEQPLLSSFFRRSLTETKTTTTNAKAKSHTSWHGKMRRIVAYVAMFPTSTLSDAVLENVKQNHIACAKQAFTTNHYPCQVWKNQTSVYGRPANAQPIITPKACFRQQFSDAELALLTGKPYSSSLSLS